MPGKTSLGLEMQPIQGLTFQAIGPFLVADLTGLPDTFEAIPIAQHGMEAVGARQKTKPHNHNFLSLYKSERLDVECNGKRFKLPHRSLTIVLPGVQHSWVPQNNKGSVGSVDQRHRKQKVV